MTARVSVMGQVQNRRTWRLLLSALLSTGVVSASLGAPTMAGRVVPSGLDLHLQGRDPLPVVNGGWLILTTTRLSPPRANGCGALRSISLETGSIFVHDGCTDRASTGRVSADDARNAMRILLSGDLGTGRAAAGDAVFTWRWVMSTDVSLIGDLRRATGSGALAGPVQRLFDDFEALQPDPCAPPLPPPAQVLAATLPRMINPVSADESQELTAAYRRARERWARLSACRP